MCFNFKLNNTHNILLFDGICNLCNGVVQFVIKCDKKEKVKFASLQSEAGKQLLIKYNLPAEDYQSFVYIKNGQFLLKSTAALTLMKDIGGGWQLLYFFIIIPKFIRDFIYSVVAKNRYKWFGKKGVCMIPNKKLHHRFLY